MANQLADDPVVDRSLKHSIKDGIFFSAMVGGAESYFSAFAVFLKATTAQIGVLASMGFAAVDVYRRPRVALLGSGDELVDLDRFDEARAGRKIVSSNGYTLHALVRSAGGEPVNLGFVGDSPEALREGLMRAHGCDLILTTAGISVGELDYTRDVLAGDARGCPALAEEPRNCVRRLARCREKKLERDTLIELGVARCHDHAHPASPEDPLDHVLPREDISGIHGRDRN